MRSFAFLFSLPYRLFSKQLSRIAMKVVAISFLTFSCDSEKNISLIDVTILLTVFATDGSLSLLRSIRSVLKLNAIVPIKLTCAENCLKLAFSLAAVYLAIVVAVLSNSDLRKTEATCEFPEYYFIIF